MPTQYEVYARRGRDRVRCGSATPADAQGRIVVTLDWWPPGGRFELTPAVAAPLGKLVGEVCWALGLLEADLAQLRALYGDSAPPARYAPAWGRCAALVRLACRKAGVTPRALVARVVAATTPAWFSRHLGVLAEVLPLKELYE